MSTSQTGLRANLQPALASLGSRLGQVCTWRPRTLPNGLYILPGPPESHSTFMIFALTLYYPSSVLGVWALPREKSLSRVALPHPLPEPCPHAARHLCRVNSRGAVPNAAVRWPVARTQPFVPGSPPGPLKVPLSPMVLGWQGAFSIPQRPIWVRC